MLSKFINTLAAYFVSLPDHLGALAYLALHLYAAVLTLSLFPCLWLLFAAVSSDDREAIYTSTLLLALVLGQIWASIRLIALTETGGESSQKRNGL